MPGLIFFIVSKSHASVYLSNSTLLGVGLKPAVVPIRHTALPYWHDSEDSRRITGPARRPVRFLDRSTPGLKKIPPCCGARGRV